MEQNSLLTPLQIVAHRNNYDLIQADASKRARKPGFEKIASCTEKREREEREEKEESNTERGKKKKLTSTRN